MRQPQHDDHLFSAVLSGGLSPRSPRGATANGAGGAAIGVGLIGAKAVEAVGRNPGASGKILVQSILGMALAEAVAFYVIFLA